MIVVAHPVLIVHRCVGKIRSKNPLIYSILSSKLQGHCIPDKRKRTYSTAVGNGS